MTEDNCMKKYWISACLSKLWVR